VSVDGKLIAAAAPTRIFRFHKPAGLITAERDPAGRPDDLQRAAQCAARRYAARDAGGPPRPQHRGLLLLTNDGELKRALELPPPASAHLSRPHLWRHQPGQLEELIEGIEIDGVRYGPIDANMERRTGATSGSK
jgi:23S rRNA pseudouridine2605 synthase